MRIMCLFFSLVFVGFLFCGCEEVWEERLCEGEENDVHINPEDFPTLVFDLTSGVSYGDSVGVSLISCQGADLTSDIQSIYLRDPSKGEILIERDSEGISAIHVIARYNGEINVIARYGQDFIYGSFRAEAVIWIDVTADKCHLDVGEEQEIVVSKREGTSSEFYNPLVQFLLIQPNGIPVSDPFDTSNSVGHLIYNVSDGETRIRGTADGFIHLRVQKTFGGRTYITDKWFVIGAPPVEKIFSLTPLSSAFVGSSSLLPVGIQPDSSLGYPSGTIITGLGLYESIEPLSGGYVISSSQGEGKIEYIVPGTIEIRTSLGDEHCVHTIVILREYDRTHPQSGYSIARYAGCIYILVDSNLVYDRNLIDPEEQIPTFCHMTTGNSEAEGQMGRFNEVYVWKFPYCVDKGRGGNIRFSSQEEGTQDPLFTPTDSMEDVIFYGLDHVEDENGKCSLLLFAP